MWRIDDAPFRRVGLLIDYLKYWSLLRRPFSIEPEHIFFAGIPQREAIAGLNDLASNRFDMALLVAPPRCGMTSLLRYVQRMRGFGDCAAEMILTEGNRSCDAAVHLARSCRWARRAHPAPRSGSASPAR